MRYLSCLKPIVNLRCSKFYQNTSISWKLLVQENGQRYLASSVGICESVDSKDKKIQQHKQDLQQRHESKLAGRIRNSQTHANLEVNNAALLSTSISVSEDDLAWKEVLDDSNYQKMINDELKNSTQLRTDLPSLYKRKLDQDLCIPFNSEKGKKIFMSSLGGKYGNIYHTLSLQFVTQYNSLFCGPSSLVMVLNALHVDPGREWKYPWRWYDDEMLNSCKPIQHTSSNGCSLDALACMAKSNHLTVEIVRASLEWQIEDFRRDVMRSCSSYDQPMIANFSRSMFNQTGTGHFSPIGGYDEVTDMILVMETARFKYPPFWVELEKMWEAMRSIAVNGKGISSVQKLNARVKDGNHYNDLIYQHIRRITLVSQNTIKVLDPKIIAKFNNVSNQLKIEIQQKNRTVLEYGIAQIADEYDETKDASQSEVDDASVIEGFPQKTGYQKMTADMFKMMKTDAVAEFMKKDVSKQLSKAHNDANKVFGFDFEKKQFERNQVKSELSTAIDFNKDYISTRKVTLQVLTLVLSGPFTLITDIESCNKRKNGLEENIVPLRKAHEEIKQTFNDLSKYQNGAEKSWKMVREQSLSEAVFDQLETVEEIAKMTSSKSSKSIQAVKYISLFRSQAKGATPDNFLKLQNQLAVALSDIGFTAECYERKLAMYESVYRSCKKGTANFVDLYNRALFDFKPNQSGCRDSAGLPYTTRKDVQNFLKKKADKEKFEVNCLLNKGLKKAITCEEVNSGYSLQQISTKLNITLSTAKSIKESCPLHVLSVKENEEVCRLSNFLKLDTIFKVFPEIRKNGLKTAFGNC